MELPKNSTITLHIKRSKKESVHKYIKWGRELRFGGGEFDEVFKQFIILTFTKKETKQMFSKLKKPKSRREKFIKIKIK